MVSKEAKVFFILQGKVMLKVEHAEGHDTADACFVVQADY